MRISKLHVCWGMGGSGVWSDLKYLKNEDSTGPNPRDLRLRNTGFPRFCGKPVRNPKDMIAKLDLNVYAISVKLNDLSTQF